MFKYRTYKLSVRDGEFTLDTTFEKGDFSQLHAKLDSPRLPSMVPKTFHTTSHIASFRAAMSLKIDLL